MSKILVTGAEGFIGSHLVENLVKKGYDTVKVNGVEFTMGQGEIE